MSKGHEQEKIWSVSKPCVEGHKVSKDYSGIGQEMYRGAGYRGTCLSLGNFALILNWHTLIHSPSQYRTAFHRVHR